MHGILADIYLLKFKSRNSFIRIECLARNPKIERIEKWREKVRNKTSWIMLTKNFALGHRNK